LGVGMIAVVSPDAAARVIAGLGAAGIHSWEAGRVAVGALPSSASGSARFEQGAKGVDGGAVRLTGAYSN